MLYLYFTVPHPTAHLLHIREEYQPAPCQTLGHIPRISPSPRNSHVSQGNHGFVISSTVYWGSIAIYVDTLGTERGGAPKTRKSMSEFRGETRARVVLIGGGGAVTGTVSSLFSWVWYASRDWPPTALLSVESIFVFLSTLNRRIESRESRAKLASRARNSRRKENSFSRTPSETSPKFFSQIIDHSTIVRLWWSNNHECHVYVLRIQEYLLVILSWQDKRTITWRGVSRCVFVRNFFNFIRQDTYVTRISRKRRLLCGCFSWRRTVDVTKLGV